MGNEIKTFLYKGNFGELTIRYTVSFVPAADDTERRVVHVLDSKLNGKLVYPPDGEQTMIIEEIYTYEEDKDLELDS